MKIYYDGKYSQIRTLLEEVDIDALQESKILTDAENGISFEIDKNLSNRSKEGIELLRDSKVPSRLLHVAINKEVFEEFLNHKDKDSFIKRIATSLSLELKSDN